ncbi:MAG: polysaccharide biosynthesis tyrosine autokinase, partial [Abditibacteriota bacterium]|nr:polysaccharide biosynthesis tyrosine autokinase [Abditibacteriota bacterium]
MQNISKDLNDVRKELAEYKKLTGIYLPEDGTDVSAMLQRRATVDSDLEKAKIELESAKASLAALEAVSKAEPDKEVTSANQTNPSVAAIMTRIDNLTSEKAELLQKYTPDSPEVTAISNQIEFETKKLAEARDNYVESSRTYADNPAKTSLKSEKNKLVASIAELKERIANLAALDSKKDAEAAMLPDSLNKFMELSERYKILQDTMQQLTQSYYTLSINAETSLSSGYIVSEAIPNRHPVEPSVKKNVAIFFLLGLIFGLMAAYIVDNLDNAIHDDETVNKITTLPCLGRIPLVELAPGERAQLGMSKKDQLLEPFRIFRNNVLFSHYESNDKVLAITGPDAKQGKSTISVNLAIVLALDGKKVLLVDADLRKPNIARWFGLKNNIGYSNLVKGLCTYEEAIRESGIPGLSLLTTGPLPPNPAEFLSSKANMEVVEKLKSMFDYIIYDTSPCTFISDSQIVATYVDGMIMTVTCKQTKRNSLKFALDAMKTVNAPLIGYVLNKLPMTKRGYYSKYYYYSSYSSYTDEDSRKKR